MQKDKPPRLPPDPDAIDPTTALQGGLLFIEAATAAMEAGVFDALNHPDNARVAKVIVAATTAGIIYLGTRKKS